MKYIKAIVIFFISLNLSALCAEDSTLIEPTLSADIQNAAIKVEPNEKNTTTATSAEENELQDWDNHLKTLRTKGDNWVVESNVPTDSWTTETFNLAEKAMATNNTLSEELKSSFSAAIKEKIAQENGTDTLSSKLLIKNFDEKIEELKKQTGPESTTKKTEEATSTTSTKEVMPAQETQQISTDETTTTEQPTPSETTSSTASSTPSTESTTKSETTETPQEEKKENLTEEWKQCLTDMQSRRGDINNLIKNATELAQKLHDSNSMDKRKLTQAFTAALEGATVARKLPPYYKDDALSNFASALGIYMPAAGAPMNYYDQPTESELAMLQQQEELEEMQRKQMEQDERIEAAEREAEHQRMIAQAAALDAVRKQQLSVDQWQKTQESLMKAEQRKLAQLEKEADQLREKTRELEAQLKKTAEKSYLTRAKETVSELIWGPSESTQSVEKIAQQKKQLEQQLADKEKEMKHEHNELTEQRHRKNEQAKREKELRALTGHILTTKEQERKAELEAEQKEALEIANLNNFELQKKEWPIFIRSIKKMEKPTIEDNNKVTAEAIAKATSLLNLASKMPFVNIIELEQMLKETFAKALVNQKQKNQHSLNIAVKQDQFNKAVNRVVDEVTKPARLKYFSTIEKEINKNQPTKRDVENRE